MPKHWQQFLALTKMNIGRRMAMYILMFIYLHKRQADKVPTITAALRAIKAEGLNARVCQKKIAPLAKFQVICQTK